MTAGSLASERPVAQSVRWYYYIHLCGQPGLSWLSQYESAHGMDIARRLDRVIGLCRRRRIEDARALLEECRQDVKAAGVKVDRAVMCVLNRWLFSTEAFFLYSCRDLDGALEKLEWSSDAIRAALREAPFLIGLAIGFAEFAVHHARIARDQRRWDDMRRQFSLARAMYQDAAPLCEIGEGNHIFVHHIDEFVESLSPRTAEEEESLRFLLNRKVLVDSLEMLIRRVELLPNVVIPFE